MAIISIPLNKNVLYVMNITLIKIFITRVFISFVFNWDISIYISGVHCIDMIRLTYCNMITTIYLANTMSQ